MEERIEKLEQDLERSYRLLIIFGFCALFAVLFIASENLTAEEEVMDVIRVRTIYIVDENGKDRAMLSMLLGGPGLFLYGENDKPRAMLTETEYGARLGLHDMNGLTRAMLIVTKTALI